MNVKEKIEAFGRIVEKEAEEQRIKILKEIEEKIEIGYREKVNEAKAVWDRKTKAETYKVQMQENKELIAYESESKKKLMAKRRDIIESVFSRVKTELFQYRSTPEYISYLAENIKKVVSADPDSIIYLIKEDMKLVPEINAKLNANLSYRESEENFIGGFKAYLNKKNIVIDNSFLTKLNAEKDKFNPFTTEV